MPSQPKGPTPSQPKVLLHPTHRSDTTPTYRSLSIQPTGPTPSQPRCSSPLSLHILHHPNRRSYIFLTYGSSSTQPTGATPSQPTDPSLSSPQVPQPSSESHRCHHLIGFAVCPAQPEVHWKPQIVKSHEQGTSPLSSFKV